MRIGVSGPHGTGKTTLVEELCGRLGDHTPVDEPYVLLAEEGHEVGFPPTPADFRVQLARSVDALALPSTKLVFDRTPLDFLAYLAVLQVDLETEVDARVRAAMASLDLLIIVAITEETERMLPAAHMPALRRAVNEALLDLAYADPLQLCETVSVVELAGPLTGRIDAVLAAIANRPLPP